MLRARVAYAASSLDFSSRRLVASGIDVCVDVQMKLERRVNIDDANQLLIDEFLDAQSLQAMLTFQS
ncbi:hypothetical protein P4119_15255 [Pseudomonas aeruginosa]|nr:hypothetical protein [Pseudomonas aeruginosa]